MWALNAGNHTLSMHFTSLCLPRPAPGPLPQGPAPWAALAWTGQHIPRDRAVHSPASWGQSCAQPSQLGTLLTQPCCKVGLRAPSPASPVVLSGSDQLAPAKGAALWLSGKFCCSGFWEESSKAEVPFRPFGGGGLRRDVAIGITPHIQAHSRLDIDHRHSCTPSPASGMFQQDCIGLYEKSSISL